MIRTKFKTFFFLPALLLLLLVFNNGRGQTVSEFVKIDSLQVGDTFNYSVTLNRSKEYDQLAFPDSSHFGDSFEIRSRRHYQITTYKDSVSYKLQFFATADTTIPALPVTLIQQQDTTVLYTNPVRIPFHSVLAKDEQEFRPLKPIFDFAEAWWPYILALLILIAAGYLFYHYYWKKRKTEEPKEPKTFSPETFVNPLIQLEKAIKELEQSKLDSHEDFKAFYIRLGDAIRRYYEDLYRIPALESTSGELLRALHKRVVDDDLLADTRAVLQEADMVKFAKFQPTNEQAKRALRKAHNFLERAQDVDGPRIEQMRRKHKSQVETERKQFYEEQNHKEVKA
ncbi:hypothetical protein [Fodinibius halophilus]|uniref:Protein BatD n=1 Tax=Fodinibius halophilus TaxID=1736908 RepID=A0A6M1SSJ2_9BACT|nr:hypothetical protein [Fodinibius halophilus]NGP86898.1 hypothetical protein [Fodinibius halophilus]